jgi:hypothetical protein
LLETVSKDGDKKTRTGSTKGSRNESLINCNDFNRQTEEQALKERIRNDSTPLINSNDYNRHNWGTSSEKAAGMRVFN